MKLEFIWDVHTILEDFSFSEIEKMTIGRIDELVSAKVASDKRNRDAVENKKFNNEMKKKKTRFM